MTLTYKTERHLERKLETSKEWIVRMGWVVFRLRAEMMVGNKEWKKDVHGSDGLVAFCYPNPIVGMALWIRHVMIESKCVALVLVAMSDI